MFVAGNKEDNEFPCLMKERNELIVLEGRYKIS